jgi:VanZ family protein
MQNHKQIKSYPPFIFIAYTIILLAASVLPSLGELSKTKIELIFELRLDYLLHFTAYFGFFALFTFSCILNTNFFTRPDFKKLIIGTLIMATGTELLQYFTPYRTFNPFDMLFNVSGILTGVFVYRMYNNLIKTKNIGLN